MAWWHRYTAARSPCQTSGSSGRWRSVRAQSSSAPDDSSAQNRRANPRPSWSSRVMYGCDASQAIIPIPTNARIAKDQRRRPITPVRPGQPRQQHRRAEARHQDDRRGDVLHRPGAAAVGITAQERGGQSQGERGEQQREDRLRPPPQIGHDRRHDQRRGQRAGPDGPLRRDRRTSGWCAPSTSQTSNGPGERGGNAPAQ